jgi:SAM-dependent methyltransferase
MKNFKFNFKSENKELMDNLKFLQINESNKEFLERSEEEYEKLKDIIFAKKPNKILDVGSGIGRSSVYFNSLENLKDTKFYLADFTGKEFDKTDYCGSHDNANPIPYNSLEITEEFCKNNNMNMDNFKTIDLATEDIKNLKKIDLIYSFHCIGYHWSIQDAFDNYGLDNISHDDTIFVFGCRAGHDISEYPEKIGNYKLKHQIPGDFFQQFLVYKKD